MPAPTAAQYISYRFRDKRLQTSRMRVLLGGASAAAIATAAASGTTLLGAVSTNSVFCTTLAGFNDHTPGGAGQFQNTEDKMILTFLDPVGGVHRYQVGGPKAVCFLADLETVDRTQTDVAALITWFQANAYAIETNAATLSFVGGVRGRVKTIRKVNIFTLDPTETIPAE